MSSVTKYLEICSQNRNRSLYPNPASFEVLISQSGSKGKTDALDPVSNSAPTVEWYPISMIGNVGGPGSGAVATNNTNTISYILVNFPTSVCSTNHTPNYYAGLPITIGSTNTIITTTDYQSSHTGYDSFWIGISPSLSTVPVSGTIVTSSNTIDVTDGSIWVPTGINADNWFADNFIVWNDSTKTYASILAYDGVTNTIGVNASDIVGWVQSNNLVIRSFAPLSNNVTQTGTVVPNSVYLNSSTSLYNGAYTGDFLRIPPQTIGSQGVIYRISNYVGSTHLAILTSLVNTVSVPVIAPGTPYEILQFSKDNAYPFVYTGSTVSQQEMSCYEIQLSNLILPNKTLTFGGRAAFYPYVYVELQNVSGSGGRLSNTIYSNNPNATKMLFRASIDDIRDPLVSTFCRVDGDGMRQTIKFSPNDNLKFAVYLSNGDLFETLVHDTTSPLSPDPLVQISALFVLKKI